MKLKKVLFGVGVSVAMALVASQALAVAFAPGVMGNFDAMQQQSQQMQAYMAQLAQGTLSPQDQMNMARLMQTRPGTFTMAIAGEQGDMGYKVMAGNAGVFMARGHGNQAAWFALMFIFTVMMVWVVLLLLIGVLWHQLKKHKHH